MTDVLNLTALQKAVVSFDRALTEFAKDTHNEFVRDSCIQRFEYCYDLSTKMIKRHLSNISENPSAIHEMTFQQVIREAYTKGVIKHSWDKWSEYRDDRNATSHGYDEERAKLVVASIVVFYEEVSFCLSNCRGFMKLLFDVTVAEYQIVREVLATHLDDDCQVWVFGSRAKNTARFNSDLDLAIECAEPLSKQALIALNESFDEAKLAFSVDVVDLKQVESYFKDIIDSHKVVFPYQEDQMLLNHVALTNSPPT